MANSVSECFVVLLSCLPATLCSAQNSAYSNAVLNLHPVAYWPLQETTPPPNYDIETNYGSLGPIAKAYYASTAAAHGFTPGAIVGDTDPAVNFAGSSSSFGVVPTTDNRISLKAGQPFTVECWARATGGQSYVAMVNQTGPNNAGGLNGVNNSSGWSLCQNFAPYRGTLSGNNPPCFSFHVFNGIGFTGGAEVEIPNNTFTYQNVWLHLVGVFDGTNAWLYINGDTNLMNFQIPITTGATPSGSPAGTYGSPVDGATFSPDTWDPILFGCTRGLGANPYHGCVDEVAIYTNALTSDQVLNHYIAGTNGLGTYVTTIQGDHPFMYWRMDAPTYISPPVTSYPTAANYGSAAAAMTNFNTLGNSAVYQPGTVPGVAGPASAGFGSLTNACAFNGLSGAVDAGYNTLLDPTGVANNFTVLAWFKGNPMDSNGRFNCLASHSDSSWKMQFQNGNTKGYKGVNPQPNIAPATFNVNDGNWHMLVLESTYTNGVSTNVTIYLDNGQVSATAAVPSPVPGKPTLDAFIGGAPDYLEPANHTTYNTAQQFFAGSVAHVAYFTNVLTLSQIGTLFYTAEPTPVILTQPVSASVDLNGAFTNTVGAGGAVPYSYQWYRDNTPLAGQTTANLVLNPVHLTDNSTNYYVVVTNNYGSVTSSVVSLTVVSNLMLIGQSPVTYTNPITLYGGGIVNGTNYLGSTPTFSVSAMGALPISYQWRTNGVAVSGANSASFTFPNCQMTGPTSFDCVLGNSYGPLTSMVWSVSYVPAPTAPFPQAVLGSQPIAYWRLNEPDDMLNDGNPGAICNDYQSGNNGIYTNVYLGNLLGGTGYSPSTDPSEKAAQFGAYAASACFAGGVGTNVDFSAPAGKSAEFTVAVWANGNSTTQPGNAGLVTKGYFNGEEFTLDEGSAALGTALRFSVRDASGAAHDAGSTIKLANDSNWHFVVGVCDEANGRTSLYVDGLLAASNTIPVGGGIVNSASVPLMIGARSSVATAPGNQQFKGFLNEAACYNYAMSPQQIVQSYSAAGVAPFFVAEPVASTNANQGGSVMIPTTVGGSEPLAYQWYSASTDSLPGQTNATLVLNNVAQSDAYYLMVTNAYGPATSTYVSVAVFSGLPVILTDVQNPFYGLPGGIATNSVLAYGTAPLTYQWQFSNTLGLVNLTDNSRISGSQSSALTIANLQGSDAGSYQVIVGNSYGSVTSSLAPLVIPGVLPLTFYANGSGWQQNSSARFANGTVTLTDPNGGGGTGSYFFQVPQYIGAFWASFTYQVGGNMAADGTTFCLQNDSRGATALGGGGGQLGYEGIYPSVALELNIFSGNGVGGVGYSFDADGAIGPTGPTGGVHINGGDPIDVIVYYAEGNLSLTFTDEVATTSFSTNLYVGDLSSVLGSDSAYVGFTGSYGGLTSVQTVSNFQFISIPPEDIQIENGTNVVISWPGTVLGYNLQENSDLTTPNWVTVPGTSVLSNGLNQVTLPKGANNQFYRLFLQP